MSIKRQDRYETFVREYERLVFTVCLTFTKNYFDAEDLAQETFLSAYRSFDAFDGKNPKAWLTTIAANKCRDFLKSPARRVDALSAEELDLLQDDAASPENELLKKDAAHRMRLLCGRLREPYRSTATEYFCENRKLSEISQNTGQNLKTLETQLYRAKKLLKVLWEEEPA